MTEYIVYLIDHLQASIQEGLSFSWSFSNGGQTIPYNYLIYMYLCCLCICTALTKFIAYH